MYKPFNKEVPTYPGEERSKDLPTAETTVFNSTAVVQSAEIFSELLSPHINARGRENILRRTLQFCVTSTQREQLISHGNSLLDSIEALPTEDQEESRLEKIRYLLGKVQERYSTEKADLPELSKEIIKARKEPLVLPERSRWRVPTIAVKLVNDCYAGTWSDDYGSTIPVITEGDTYVYPNNSLQRYLKHRALQESHSFNFRRSEQIRKRFPTTTMNPRFDIIATEHALPGKPILIPESEIAGWHNKSTSMIRPDAREAGGISMLTAYLVHEGLHRASKGIPLYEYAVPVTNDSPLFHYAFSTSKYVVEHQQRADIKEALQEMHDERVEYALKHEPAVVIVGARVMLFCRDEDSVMRILVESGYDFDEAIVESLALQSIIPLMHYLSDNYSSNVVNTAKDVITRIGMEMAGSSRYQNFMGRIVPDLEKLKIPRPIDTLRAHANGQIPFLHMQYLPDQDYWT